MKKILTLAAVAAIAMTGAAQSKISLPGLFKLQEIAELPRSRACDPMQQKIDAIVTMNPGWDTDGFDACNATIELEVEPDLLLMTIPAADIEKFSQLPQVKYVEFGVEYHMTMDMARPASQVTAVQAGIDVNGQTVVYDGSGVVAGLMDQGIDPNHINFKDANGNPRVMQAFNYTNKVSCTTPEAVLNFTTDDASASHGTHVAGIMAGSYNGPGNYVYNNTPTGNALGPVDGNIPYYGVATGSKIVMASGVFTSTNIVKGVQAVQAYAKTIGAPCVTNLSLGSNQGPHDGTDGTSRSVAGLIKAGNIVCIASGNEGSYNCFVGKKFTADDTQLKTFFLNNKSWGVDIWGNSATPFTVQINMVNPSTGSSTQVAKVDGTTTSSTAGGTFSTYFSGTLSLAATKNVINNRWNVAVAGTIAPKSGGMNLEMIITGADGQQVYCYGYGSNNNMTQFTSGSKTGYTDGTPDGSLSNTACGNNMIVVGSYTTRTKWATYGGNYSFTNSAFVTGEVSPFSSYGTAYNGTVLPSICAPGAGIVSSLNRYYTSQLAAGSLNGQTSAKADASGSTMTNYWGESQGTSMACPYASGVVAMWLQADPTLTAQEIIAIMQETAVKPTADGMLAAVQRKPPTGSDGPTQIQLQWGGGKLMALDGLRKVLERNSAGIDGVTADAADRLHITTIGVRTLDILNPQATSMTAQVYNLQGMEVAGYQSDCNTITVDAQHLQPGIYILKVTSPETGTTTRRISLH